MEPEDLRDLIAQINDDIAGIVFGQQIIGDVHRELRERAATPLEEDFIDLDAFGYGVGVPRTVEIDGIELEITKLHRKGLGASDLKGADLLYEMAGEKYALIQYKRIDGRNRVLKDGDQLEELIGACPARCASGSATKWVTCGGWVSIQTLNGAYYLPACEVKSLFGKAHTRASNKFAHGISKQTFQELFARCRIGARVAPVNLALMTWNAMESDRLLVVALQRRHPSKRPSGT